MKQELTFCVLRLETGLVEEHTPKGLEISHCSYHLDYVIKPEQRQTSYTLTMCPWLSDNNLIMIDYFLLLDIGFTCPL